MAEDPATRKRRHKDLPKRFEVIHRDSVENLIRLKRQLWQATYYAMLVYAGIFAVSRAIAPTDDEKRWLTWLVVLTWLAASYIVTSTQRGMEKNRARLGWIYSECYDDVEVLKLRLDTQIAQKSFWKDPEFYLGSMVSLAIGAGIVLYLLWREAPVAVARLWWQVW